MRKLLPYFYLLAILPVICSADSAAQVWRFTAEQTAKSTSTYRTPGMDMKGFLRAVSGTQKLVAEPFHAMWSPRKTTADAKQRSASKQDSTAHRFIPEQRNSANNIRVVSSASGGGLSCGFQDIPDYGYVRIYFGIVSQESYEIFPETSGFDSIWCQNPDRSSGIRILQYGDLWEGDLFYLEGFMGTTPEDERVILPLGVYPISYGFPLQRPIYVPGLTMGLNPTIQVKISGKVVTEPVYADPDACTYYIDDGSRLETGIPGVNGIEVVDPYYSHNPAVVLGEQIYITGSLSYKVDASGDIRRRLYRSTDGYNAVPYTGTTMHTISGTVTADTEAAGQTIWIGCDGGWTTPVFDDNGTATYELQLNEGDYNIYARTPGYGSELWWVGVYGDYPGVDFIVYPMIYYDNNGNPVVEKEIIEVVIENVTMNHDETTNKGFVLDRDFEGKRWAGKPVSVMVDKGMIVSCDSVTDEKGKAHFVLRSSTKTEVATVTATAGTLVSRTLVYYIEEGDPIVTVLAPTYGETVSGVTNLMIEVNDTNPDGVEDIRQRRLIIDGSKVGTFRNYDSDFQPDEGASEGGLDTTRLSNGWHELWAEVIQQADGTTTTSTSNVVRIYVNNPVHVNISPQRYIGVEGQDQPLTMDMDFRDNTNWSLEIRGFVSSDDQDDVVFSASGTGSGSTQIAWDGKVDDVLFPGVFEIVLITNQIEPPGEEQEWKYYWSQSTPGEALITGVIYDESFWGKHSCYKMMNAAGFNCRKRGIRPTYVLDPYWLTDADDPDNIIYGLDHWIGNMGGFGYNFRHFFLFTEGAMVPCQDGIERAVVWFADGRMVFGDDSWDQMPQITDAFTDLQMPAHRFKIVQINSCWSSGSEEFPDTSIARAFGCRDDEMGSTYMGWNWYFKPLGAYFLLGFSPNGEGWTRAFWKFLGNGRSFNQAIYDIHHSVNPFYRGYMENHEAPYTWHSSWATFLE